MALLVSKKEIFKENWRKNLLLTLGYGKKVGSNTTEELSKSLEAIFIDIEKGASVSLSQVGSLNDIKFYKKSYLRKFFSNKSKEELSAGWIVMFCESFDQEKEEFKVYRLKEGAKKEEKVLFSLVSDDTSSKDNKSPSSMENWSMKNWSTNQILLYGGIATALIAVPVVLFLFLGEKEEYRSKNNMLL